MKTVLMAAPYSNFFGLIYSMDSLQTELREECLTSMSLLLTL